MTCLDRQVLGAGTEAVNPYHQDEKSLLKDVSSSHCCFLIHIQRGMGLQKSDEGPAQEGRRRFSIPGDFSIKLIFFPKIPLTTCTEQENNPWSVGSHPPQSDSGSFSVWFVLFHSG